MLRSLYSGVAGMKAHLTKMDVVSNNIANVNTTGYKDQRANFQDVLYQNVKSGGDSTNAAQVGTGVGVAGISVNTTQGAIQSTGRTLDLAIQGEGYFVVAKDDSPSDSDLRYTRDGTMFIDQEGYLVNSNGYKLMGGDDGTDPIQIDLSSDKTVGTLNISPTGLITGTYTDGTDIDFEGSSDGQIVLATFPNSEGLQKAGQNLYTSNTAITGEAQYADPSGTTTIASGYLEMSNVDLSEEFVNVITAQRGFQANSRTITVSDSMLEELINLKR